MRRGVLCAAVALLSATAHADPEPAEVLMDQGIALREAHRDEEALAVFQLAFAMCRCPRAEAQIGMAEWAIGRDCDAQEHIRHAMERADDPWITSHRDVLIAALTALQSGGVRAEVSADVTGATVRVDDAVRGVTPARLCLPTGAHGVRVEADGRLPMTLDLDVHASEPVRLSVTLPRPPERAVRALPAARAEVVTQPTRGALVARRWRAAALSGAAVALAAATTLHIEQQLYVGVWNDDARCLANHQSREANCGAIGRTAAALVPWTIAAWAVAGTLTVGAALVWWRSTRREPVRRAALCVPSVGAWGIECGAAF